MTASFGARYCGRRIIQHGWPGRPSSEGDSPRLGESRVHRSHNEQHQKNRRLSELFRHVLSIPPGHPQREADSVGEKDRVHRGQSDKRRDPDLEKTMGPYVLPESVYPPTHPPPRAFGLSVLDSTFPFLGGIITDHFYIL